MNKNIVMGIAGVVIAGVFFFGGMKYAESKSPASGTFRAFTSGPGGQVAIRGARGGMNGGFTGGQIISKDATSLTVGVQGGGSKIVFVTSSTPIQKMVSGTASDLVVGQDVAIVGTPNADGSISATSIQIRPATTTRMVQ